MKVNDTVEMTASSQSHDDAPRHGFVDAKGILMPVACSVGIAIALFLLFDAFHDESVEKDSHVSPVASKSSSNHPVSQLVIDGQGERLWAFGYATGWTSIDLETWMVASEIPMAVADCTSIVHCDSSTLMLTPTNNVQFIKEGQATVFKQLHLDDKVRLALSTDGRTALAVTDLGKVVGWTINSVSMTDIAYHLPFGAEIAAVRMCHDNRHMMVSHINGEISTHDAISGELLAPPVEVGGRCKFTQGGENGCPIVTAFEDGTIRVLNATSGELLSEVALPGYGSPTALGVSSDGQWIAATTTVSNAIYCWNLKSPHVMAVLQGHDGIVSTIVFSPESNNLYSGSYDGTIREWSIESGGEVRVIDVSKSVKKSTS